MSNVSHAHSSHPSLGGLLTRILVIIVVWVSLVFGLIHYVGHVIPTAYQVSQAAQAAADLKAHEAATATTPAAAQAVPASTAVAAPAPAAASASASASTTAAPAVAAASAPAAGSAAPATTSPTAVAAAPKASGEKKLPVDVRLAGLNRTALTNVSIFFSIVASVFCLGAIILQMFKYCHKEEEAAH